jgi:hypothetical protein
MKRLMILTALGMLLSGAVGCRFMECLWRGPATQSCPPAVAYPSPSMSYSPSDPCCPGGGAAAVVTPGPETYAPATR